MEHREDSGVRIQFQEPLSWRAGKAIPVGDLLRRLQALASELRSLSQEEIDRDSITPRATELASVNLLGHKDKGVRAHTACCLADVLRLCAPDAPYSDHQLKDVFTLFVSSIIPALSDPHDPYNQQHIYVLESLSGVKSIVLLTDAPSSGNLILRLFTSCFDILAAPDDAMSKNVEYHMTGLLQSMIDECEGLPPGVVDIILAQFLRADPRANPIFAKNKKNGQKDGSSDTGAAPQNQRLPPSYVLARNLCNTCVDKMSRYISQYFGSVVIDTTSTNLDMKSKSKTKGRIRAPSIDSDEELQAGPSEDDVQQLRRAHQLLRELWRSCPGTLQNVIPQVEAELSAEDVQLRAIATETIGDLAAGVGAAGLSLPAPINPAAYPPVTLDSEDQQGQRHPGSFTPSSPTPFSQAHISTYHNFLGRRNDKSAVIRALWTTRIARVLTTSAGGAGMDHRSQQYLMRELAEMLVDSDEKVRLAAVEALGLFSLRDFTEKVGPFEEEQNGRSILENLHQRIKDKRPAIRNAAIRLLGNIWSLGFGEIAAGNDRVKTLLGSIPSNIFEAIYVNDPEINSHIDKVFYENFLPPHYPAIKKNAKYQASGTSSQADGPRLGGEHDPLSFDADKLRVERMLLITSDLDERAKKAFNVIIFRHAQTSQYMHTFLKRCEDFNGGVMDKDEKEEKGIKVGLARLVEYFSLGLPEASRAADDLWKFAKAHDRRCYALIRFCMASDSDFRKLQRSLKELDKRIAGSSSATPPMVATLNLLVCKAANILSNKSHIRPIIEISQSNEKALGSAAHELLRHISSKNASVFTIHAEEVCRSLELQAPSAAKANDDNALDLLKTCSIFARRFPDKIVKDRKFFQAMVQFALNGSPPKAAKHAVSIIMASSDKKQIYAKDLLQKCVDGFEYGAEGFLTKLACLSQLMLLAAKDLEDDLDPVLDIAIRQVLHQSRQSAVEIGQDWQDVPGEECEAKLWALKLLVNRLRCYDDIESLGDIAAQVYMLLNTLLARNGEVSNKDPTPDPHRSRLRLQAALLHTKLCCKRGFDALLSPRGFNRLAIVAQDPVPQVRSLFVRNVMRQLGRDRLPSRFYAILFLLAFEPTMKLKDEAVTWLRARSATLSRTSTNNTNSSAKPASHVIESVFSRFLSLLAHHPDYTPAPEDLKEFAQYILFYLKAVASESNLSLIYHVAQRVKSVRDAISPSPSDGSRAPNADTVANNTDPSENLYTLSDLAQVVIRRYEEAQNWSMQTFSGKIHMPAKIFSPLCGHNAAQDIAQRQYLPDEAVEEVEGLMKGAMKARKRKNDDDHAPAVKKRVATGGPAKAADQPRKSSGEAKARKSRSRRSKSESPERSSTAPVPDSERRKSGRTATGKKSYLETAESEDDQLLEYMDERQSEGQELQQGTDVAAEETQDEGGNQREYDQNQDMNLGEDNEAKPMQIDGAPPTSNGNETENPSPSVSSNRPAKTKANAKTGKGGRAVKPSSRTLPKKSAPKRREKVKQANTRTTRRRQKTGQINGSETSETPDSELSSPPDSD